MWQFEALGYTHKKIAKHLSVDRSTVSRILKQFHATGTVMKKKYPKDRALRKLSDPAQLLILNLVINKPGIYLREIQRELLHVLLLEIEVSTICKFLHSNNFSHHKMCQVALQRDHFLRQQYMIDTQEYEPEMFIFLDETGADQRNAVRRYGYSIRGIRIQNHTIFVRGERLSAIAIMSVNGILDVCVRAGTTNSETFYEFTERCLLPHLQPFNGINPHSVVVMDNCSIHHVAGIADMIEEVGAIVHFLPPYSPDLNPIELAFSKLKSGIKDLEMSLVPSSDMEAIMLTSFAAITDEDCQGWILHCGY